uniref:VOC domain-containing protein n=1 Tax=Aegilops tauschii subsp. strangulata TaxID=200361 RepID=A0A453EBC0_AEGTS
MVNTASAGVNKAAVAAAQGGHRALPLASLNHISVVCRSLESSLSFYRDVLGFIQIRRPGSFDFDGAWLFNFGIGVHLLQAEDPESLPPKKAEINPKDNHISFTTVPTQPPPPLPHFCPLLFKALAPVCSKCREN